ncbi:MAG: alpha-L-arabinofuranosidase C-terminal domain-containing protein, partial [Pirellulaceae bacterium]
MTGLERLSAVEVRINAEGRRIEVSRDLYGIFYEEINHAGDGGLYAEMVQNRTFEENELSDHMRLVDGNVVTDNGWQYRWKPRTLLHGWSLVADDGSDVALALDDSHPLNAQSPHALKVDVRTVLGKAGFANEGYWGMSVIEGGQYLLSFYARSDQRVPVTVTLENADGAKVYADAVVENVGGDWNRYTCSLTANETDPQARLVISFRQPVTMWFDIVFLFPQHTYKNRVPGLRADLVGKLEELRPKFLRFPGGCVVEGCTLDNRIQWKRTIGDIAERPGHWNLWGYRTTDGLGFHEFLQLAEDLNAEAMYVCNVGISCQARRPEVAESTDVIINTYVQDTLDALEYATGSADSKWGSLRAQNGHPEPFRVKYVEIGNENHGPDYHRAYKLFHAAIKAKYPQIITIADQPVPDAPVEIIDEHYYVAPDWFFANAHLYDRYDRRGPKIYVGEYAVNNGVGSGNLLGALAEAAFMLGMERNSDIVTMASYAPLFENVNDREWPVNLIRFDSSRVIGRSSFYVQKMLGENLP